MSSRPTPWLAALAAATLALAAADEGFTPLFDGKTTAGWEAIGGKPDNWVAQDGLLVTRGEGGGWLSTAKPYKDFTLKLEYLLRDKGNSGVFIRSPREGDPAYTGIEIQILHDEAEVYKTLQPYQYCGSVYGVAAARRGRTKPPGEWNAMEITARGPKITVQLNGAVITEANLEEHAGAAEKHPGIKRPEGYIGLQSHSEPVEFRNVQIKVLE